MVHLGYGSDRLYQLPLLVDYQKREQLGEQFGEKSKKKYERRERRVEDPRYL